MSKLSSIIRHEYMTITKQPSFWIIMIAIPILIGGALGLSALATHSSEQRLERLSKQLKNVAIVDESQLINNNVVKESGLSLSQSSEINSLRDNVKKGQIDALIIYPANLKETKKYHIYASSNDLTKIETVSNFGDNLLKTSVFLPLKSADVIALAQDGATSTITSYKNGQESSGINGYIAPGIFVILFYVIFAFSVGYMLSSVSEEKENRSIEMVLTYTNERSIIAGKLVAVSFVALTQIMFFLLIGLIAFTVFLHYESNLQLPLGIELSAIPIDPFSVFLAASYLIVGFLMFAGFTTASAAILPSAKEANSLSTVFYIGAFIPFYFVSLILSDPHNWVTIFLSYFPLTSPIVTLLRNTVSNMSLFESLSTLVVMIFFMVLSLWLAVKAFRLGALEFNNRISLLQLFKK